MHRTLRLAALILAVVFALPPKPASSLCVSCSCSVGAGTLSFASYSLATSAQRSTGNANVTCTGTVGLAVTVALSLSSGTSGTLPNRAMAGPTSARLAYNVYLDPLDTIVFGDGTAGTATGTLALTIVLGGATASLPYYGLLPASQVVPSGNYTDAPTMTISF